MYDNWHCGTPYEDSSLKCFVVLHPGADRMSSSSHEVRDRWTGPLRTSTKNCGVNFYMSR